MLESEEIKTYQPPPSRKGRIRKEERKGRRAFLKSGIPDGGYGVIRRRSEGLRFMEQILPPEKIFYVMSPKGFLKAIRIGENGPLTRFDRVAGAERVEPISIPVEH